MKISQADFQRLNQLKKIDLQQCSFCHEITILNLGWPAFKKLHCQACQEIHVLCPELCVPVARNIFGCDLYVEYRSVVKEVVKSNKKYDLVSCYCCGKELKGASKKSVIKNRNNPTFWRIESEWKVLCLGCIGKRYLKELSKGKLRTYRKYLRRGYE